MFFKQSPSQASDPNKSRVYTLEFQTVPELYAGLGEYFEFYNTERLHQSLNYKTPQAIHFA